MPERLLDPISAVDEAARQRRVARIARELGFVGRVEYRHAIGVSGGAHYAKSPQPEQDQLVVDAKAFQRDAAGDDFSLEAIIAHERGHQLAHRHERVRRNLPNPTSTVTEEVIASLLGALIVADPRDGHNLVLKGLGDLVDCGMTLAEAQRRAEELLAYLEKLL